VVKEEEEEEEEEEDEEVVVMEEATKPLARHTTTTTTTTTSTLGGGRKRGRAASSSLSSSAAAAGGGAAVMKTGDDGKSRKPAAAAGAAATTPRLNRPLICICNDAYSPALRNLREYVQVVEFTKSSPEKLLTRLKSVAQREGLSLPRDALSTLMSITDYDVRSCLHVLQYLKGQTARQAKEAAAAAAAAAAELEGAAATSPPTATPPPLRFRITKDALLAAAVGAKDQTRALKDIWNATFRAPDTRWRPAASGGGSESAGGKSTGFAAGATTLSHPPHQPPPLGKSNNNNNNNSAALSIGVQVASAYREELFMSAAGFSSEPDLLLAGIHENLLSSRAADPTMAHTVASLDWLCYGGTITHRALSKQAYPLLKYFPVSVLGVHEHVKSELHTPKSHLEWPRRELAYRKARESALGTITAFQKCRGVCSPSTGLPLLSQSIASLTLDYISPVLTMSLCPPIKGNSFTLMNSRERLLALDAIHFIASNGITFSPTASANPYAYDVQYVMKP